MIRKPNFESVLCAIRKDIYVKDGDVEVEFLEYIYDYAQHDYLASTTLTEAILIYAGKHGLTKEKLNAIHDRKDEFRIRLPRKLLFGDRDDVRKVSKAEYERQRRRLRG